MTPQGAAPLPRHPPRPHAGGMPILPPDLAALAPDDLWTLDDAAALEPLLDADDTRPDVLGSAVCRYAQVIGPHALAHPDVLTRLQRLGTHAHDDVRAAVALLFVYDPPPADVTRVWGPWLQRRAAAEPCADLRAALCSTLPTEPA